MKFQVNCIAGWDYRWLIGHIYKRDFILLEGSICMVAIHDAKR